MWPEYSELECFACHHSLTRAEDSWRQEQGYRERRPGNPPWNHSRFVVARLIVRRLDPGNAERFEADVARLAAEVSKPQADRSAIADASGRIASMVNGLAQRVTATTVDSATVSDLLRAIAADADAIAAHGERAAEQAVMSVEVLHGALARHGRGADEKDARALLGRLFQQLQNPSAFDPRRFAAELKRAGALAR